MTSIFRKGMTQNKELENLIENLVKSLLVEGVDIYEIAERAYTLGQQNKKMEVVKNNEELERVVEEFYQHMLKSTPVLDSFERASLKLKLEELLTTYANSRIQEFVVNENTSDGFHTFKELYEFRLIYNAHIFNEWAKQGMYDVHKSQRHNDGELCFGRNDYFIVVATLPTGQISNHYPMSDWDLFKCEAVEKAKAQWDGHSSQDVATRLREALSQKYISKDKE